MIAQRPVSLAVPAPAASAPVRARPGYDATPAIAEARIRRMLEREAVAWLSTVRRDGTPSLVPTWFWWDGEAMTVFSKPEAAKVANLRVNPRLMVALGDPEEDFDVGLLEAEAAVLAGRIDVPAAFFTKYRDRLADGGLDGATFRATYTQAIRIVPVRYLGWHGRGGQPAPRPMPRLRRWLLAVRDRIASRPGPSFPRRGVAPVRMSVTSGATQLPAWA